MPAPPVIRGNSIGMATRTACSAIAAIGRSACDLGVAGATSIRWRHR